LESQSMKVRWMGNYQEALPLLMGPNPPHLVFTESVLPGGSWVEVVKLAAEAQKPVNVIVVARLADVRLYLDAIVGGAFDFIVPPLTGNELAHVVRSAADDVLSRREDQASSALAKRMALIPHFHEAALDAAKPGIVGIFDRAPAGFQPRSRSYPSVDGNGPTQSSSSQWVTRQLTGENPIRQLTD